MKALIFWGQTVSTLASFFLLFFYPQVNELPLNEGATLVSFHMQ